MREKEGSSRNWKARELGRRPFLSGLAGLAAVPLLGQSEEGPSETPIGVQLYCVRRELAQDAPGTLEALAKMGYAAVEFADYFGRSAEEWRKLLDENGLQCCGTHIYLEDLLGSRLAATLNFNSVLGNQNLIVRWLGEERRRPPEVYYRTLDTFNSLAEQLKLFGMRIGYHNHDYIFERLEGESMWNVMADRTTADVILQLDTGNASRVGQNVIELLKRNPGRTRSMHVKPYSASNPKAFIGQDELDWPQIIELARSSGGIEWFIVEYEEEGVAPLEALRANLAAFRALLAQ